MKSQITLDQITESGHDECDAALIRALCAHIDCEPSDLTERKFDHYGLRVFALGSQEYAIGTDSEATEAATANIRDSVWAFNASFILSECDLPSELEDAIQAFQSDKCESANDALLALVEKCCKDGLQGFAESAISADGRGHFMSSYDGDEDEISGEDENGEAVSFCVYRLN